MFRAALMACGTAAGAFYASSRSETACKKEDPCIFSPAEFKEFQLISSQYETHDTRRFLFSTGDAAASMNLPIASCILCKYTDAEGKAVVRPYTPINSNQTKGTFELLIKRYPKSKMGTHVFEMRVGESLEMKGPFEKFKYTPNQWSHIGMIAGGTGIAPMFQVIQGILENPKDKTHISLVYANNGRKDILLNNELATLRKAHDNFDLYFTLLDVPKRWMGGVGFINSDVLTTFMPKAGEKKTQILVCGPPPMMKAICGDKDFTKQPPGQGEVSGLLGELKYGSSQVFKY